MTTATPTAIEHIVLRPQPGKQETFLASSADIAIYGGSAGGGKTWSLLLEPLYHYKTPGFGAVVFRRTFPEIIKKGGMWDESEKLYRALGGIPREGRLEWGFTLNAHQETTINFAHCQHEKDVLSWKGAQIPLIAIDQVESFTEFQFWYLLSRNRSVCGVRPYVRATCNPVPEDDPTGGWLHRLIQWWIDPETGLAIEARAGVLRWFVRDGEQLIWDDSQEALQARYPQLPAKSLTFIPSRLEDNPILMQVDPGYLGTLLSLPMVERERLHGGNWNVKPSAGFIFNRSWFEIVEAAPVNLITARYWDKAGTDGGGCYTAGVKMGKDMKTGLVYVLDVVRGQWSAGAREQLIRQMAILDGTDTKVYTEQEPGSGGKESAQNSVINLQGFSAYADPVRGNKLKRAYPFSSYAEARNVKLLRGHWNQDYLSELHSFSPDDDGFKDQVDASSGCFNKLALHARGFVMQCAGAVSESGRSPVEAMVQHQGYYWPGDR
jgi:predicted phage terminase large subunit-like protein